MNLKTNNKRTQKGITLIALVVTIVVLLILAGVSLNAIFSENGLINRAKDAQNKMNQATQNDSNSINDLDKLISSLTNKTTEGEVPDELERYFLGEDKKGKLLNGMIKEEEENIIFIGNDIIPDAETSIKYKDMEEGADEESINIKIEYKNDYYIVTWNPETIMTKTIKKAAKITIFDTGKNVKTKINKIIPEGVIKSGGDYYDFNIAVDAILKYKGVPDLTKMTEANIVSAETSKFPIYMWFEKNGKVEIRDENGKTDLTEENEKNKKVETGIIYWWSESDNVYLNFDSSWMFSGLLYLENIDGLKEIKTDYVNDMSFMFVMIASENSKLTNVEALTEWNTSKVKNMSFMFSGPRITNIDGLRNWNTSNVTDMNSMFGSLDAASCCFKSLSSISNWDVRNVSDMYAMFLGCEIEDISEISNWNMTQIASQMFWGCNNLKRVTIPSHITKIMGQAFDFCDNLTQVKILATDANEFEVERNAFDYIASNSKIYVLSEEIKAKLEGSYDTSKTTVEVVTLDQMNNL